MMNRQTNEAIAAFRDVERKRLDLERAERALAWALGDPDVDVASYGAVTDRIIERVEDVTERADQAGWTESTRRARESQAVSL